MLSIQKIKKLLEEDGKRYDDEKVKKIRDFLYRMGEIIYGVYKSSEKPGK